MFQSLVEVLVYAAALDVYRRSNANYGRGFKEKEADASLALSDWDRRPRILAR